MFKENRLVFKFEQPKEKGSGSSSQKPGEVREKPEGLLAKAFDKLKNLEKPADQQSKINAVFDQFKPFQFIDLQKTAKLSQQQNNAFNKAFEEESIKALITKQIEAGYEFVEFSNDGLAWTWRDPVGNLTTRINPLFKSEDIRPVLNGETTDKLKKLHEKLINKDTETILQSLVKNGFVKDKTLPMEYLKTTDFARDIREALRVVHSLPTGHGYILDITKEGEVNFLLEDESLREKGYKDLSYNIKDYDQYLNQPNPVVETKQEKSLDVGRAEVSSETFKEVKKKELARMDAVAEKYPELQNFNTNLKTFFTDVESAIQEEINNGTAPEDILKKLETSRPDIGERWFNMQVAGSELLDKSSSEKMKFADLVGNLNRGILESYNIPTTE